MKLLQINVTANWGSTGKIAEQIGEAAINRGWESYIAYGRYYNDSKSHLIKIGNKFDVLLHYAGNRILDKEGLCSTLATKRFLLEVDRIKPDIVQLHNIHDHFLNFKLLFEYLNDKNIKVVWTLHDCWSFTGHCTHFVRKNCMKWKTGCNHCPQKSSIIDNSEDNYFLKKYLYELNNSLVVVAVSHWMASFVKESILSKKKIEVIHNGVDISKFRPLERKKDGIFRIIAVSNVWDKSKGLYDVFKLRELLPEKYKITLVGLQQEQVKKLPTGIQGICRTQNLDDLVTLYSDSDVFINTTYADTFPTVNLEALACGTPVITYRTGGSPEAINSKTGVIVDQGDVKAMAEYILAIDKNPLNREDCRDRAVAFFDKEKCFDKYISLYENLVR